jgi:hypothetical protein
MEVLDHILFLLDLYVTSSVRGIIFDFLFLALFQVSLDR